VSIIHWLFGTKKQDRLVVMKTAAEEQAQKAEPPSLKPRPVDEEQYVSECLQRKCEELPEARSWNSDPDFQKVLSPLNSGDNISACREAEALIARFGDFADLYAWWGAALVRMGALDKARQVLRDGLEKARGKYLLCNRLGEVEWKARDLDQSVYWWSQGMHCQESLAASNYGGSEGAYLYLYYVAEGIGLAECSRAFLMRVDTIRPGMIRLNTETANDLIALARSGKNRSVETVLKELVQKYMVLQRRSATVVDSNELRRLIRQLEEVANGTRDTERDTDKNAIKRLGEMGDPEAIEVLARVSRKCVLLDMKWAAQAAIEKIKEANR
jgi:hypothetical protein